MIDETKENFDTYIELSMVEIYNENIRDLLNDEFPACPTGGLKLLENEKERVTIDRVTLKRPQSADEVMALVILGNRRRSTSFTESNSQSSRSHAVLQINVGRNSRGHEVDFDQAVVRQCTSSATLSIIDLAGSERAAATRNMGARMKEGANINKSLLALSSCISALCQRPIRGMKPHVPYRNSKLTRMLKFSLGGNCRTVMIVCVSPSSKDIEDTHNTLVWANKAKNVSTKITRNTAGVAVSVQQYLTTISQQEARIKYLELKIEEGTQALSAYAKKKLEAARADARAALGHLKEEFDADVPFIVEGAKMRVLWDQAEMRAAALKGKIVELEPSTGSDSPEMARLMEMMDKQKSAFSGDARIQALLHQESAKSAVVTNLIKSNTSRSFGDAFDKPEDEAFRLKLKVTELELAAIVAAARERGYREGAQQYATMFSTMAITWTGLLHGLETQVAKLSTAEIGANDSVGVAVEKLRSLCSTTHSSYNDIFASDLSSSTASLLSLPTVKAKPLPAQPRVSRFGVPARRRLSTAPTTTTATPHRAPLKPPRRSSLAPFTLGAPRRASMAAPLASPGKQRLSKPFKVGQIKVRTPKKAFRWKDEAGEGEIDDVSTAPDAPIFTSPETGEEAVAVVDTSIGSSDEWKDEPDDRASVSSSPELQASIAPQAPLAIIGLPIPAWKQKKVILGKQIGNLSALGEEREVSSSPEPSGPSKKPGAFGPPSRPARLPLNARHQVPAKVASSPPSSAFSNLLRPTIASRSRSSINIRAQAENDPKAISIGSPPRRVISNGRMLPPSSVSKGKRRNSKGPYTSKTERRRSRGSILALGDASLSISSNGLPISLSTLGAPKGLADGLSDGSEIRRSSMMPTMSSSMRSLSGTGPGPRASLAVPTSGMATRLATKASFSKLNTASSLNLSMSTGDTSRAVWR